LIFQPPLEKATLIKRYKRFLADIDHPTRGEMTVHCANTGSMKNCWEPGWTVWISESPNKKRKYPFSWVLVQNNQNEFIGIDTLAANRLVDEALNAGKVSEINDVKTIQREMSYGSEKSKIDFLVTHNNDTKSYIEVKSVTLKEGDNKGYFPDAVTTRGQKHIRELMVCVEQGHRGILLFVVQHSGIESVQAAAHIDPDYAALLAQAVNKGVEVLVYKAQMSSTEIILDQTLIFNNEVE